MLCPGNHDGRMALEGQTRPMVSVSILALRPCQLVLDPTLSDRDMGSGILVEHSYDADPTARTVWPGVPKVRVYPTETRGKRSVVSYSGATLA